MSDIEEKRVYAEKTGRTRVFVGSGAGVARVSVSGDQVGEFGIEHRCTVHDVAGGTEQIAAATGDGVVVLGRSPTELDVGPTTAVDVREDGILVGDADGRVLRISTENDVDELGPLDAAVRAIDGGLVGTDAGVYRLVDGEPEQAGLDAVRDVSTSGTPLVAAERGVYRLGAGWMWELEGDATLVNADGGDRVHAVVDGELYARDPGAPGGDPDAWSVVSLPVEGTPVGVAYGEATYVVTADGTFLVDAGDGWRHQPLGLPEPIGCAIATS